MTILPKIQCDPYQVTNDIFHGARKKISQFLWKHKRPQIAKAVLRKKMELEDSTFLTSDYAKKLQFQDNMVLAQKYKYRPIETKRIKYLGINLPKGTK